MSHVTDIKCKVRDLDALEEACEELGLELRRDQKTYAWWGRFVGDSHQYGEHGPDEMGKCAHAIRIKGATPRDGSSGPWEIGVVPAKDGDGFKLFYDTYGGAGLALTEKVGVGAAHIKKEYATAVAKKRSLAALSRQGWKAERIDLPTGGVRLKLRKR